MTDHLAPAADLAAITELKAKYCHYVDTRRWADLGSIFTTDAEQAQRVADKIDAGMVFINGVGAEGVELPFGGIKRSGFGRELGRFGIDEFVNKKLIRTVS